MVFACLTFASCAHEEAVRAPSAGGVKKGNPNAPPMTGAVEYFGRQEVRHALSSYRPEKVHAHFLAEVLREPQLRATLMGREGPHEAVDRE